ncbi:MAG: cytochrome P450 [Burkholderiaceae bacterium]
MSDERKPDWDPRSAEVLRDQRAGYDSMRERCPVAWSDYLQWSLFRHEDIVRVLHDHETFSSAVSRHLSVPNGMDPPEHTVYRRVVEPYFSATRVDAFEPSCRQIAADLVGGVLARGEVEFMAGFARPFAVAVQCAFLGWPPALHEPLARWTRKNHEATLARDQAALSDIAREFEGFIDQMLDARRHAGAKPGDDVTAALMHETVGGQPLGDEEIASILRNWTVGEVGTIAAAVGILVEHLSRHAGLQDRLRARPALLPAAIDEILRIHGPLVANRRVATRPVEIGGRSIAAGERLSLVWVSANRDGRVFDDPDAFRLDRDPAANLLYGAGIHVCPGAPLARMELRVVIEELLGRATGIDPVPGKPATRAAYPASGFTDLPVRVR